MRVFVCGGWDYSDEAAVFGVLDALRQQYGRLTVIQAPPLE